MRKKSNLFMTLCCILFISASLMTNAQISYTHGQSYIVYPNPGSVANFHLVYNKPFSNTFPSPPVMPDIRIQANINNINHKWDIVASNNLIFKYGTGSTTATSLTLNNNGVNITGKTLYLGNRIELGERNTPNGPNYYMALGGKKLGLGWHFSGTNGGAVIQSDNQGNLSFVTHTGSSVLSPSNIAANTPLKISSQTVTLTNRNLEIVDQNGDKQFQIKDDGFLIARQVDVNLAPIPDYVFAEDYDLMPLDELEAYLKKNKHLPNIKSESEYQEAGSINLGELQLKLLEKVEELTLYTLQQQKEIEALKKELKTLEEKKN